MIPNSSEAIDHWSMVSVCFKHQDKLHPNPCGLDSLPRNKASICPLVFIPYRSSEHSQMLGFLGVEKEVQGYAAARPSCAWFPGATDIHSEYQINFIESSLAVQKRV